MYWVYQASFFNIFPFLAGPFLAGLASGSLGAGAFDFGAALVAGGGGGALDVVGDSLWGREVTGASLTSILSTSGWILLFLHHTV